VRYALVNVVIVREECRLRGSENRCQEEEIPGEWRKLHNKELHNFYLVSNKDEKWIQNISYKPLSEVVACEA